MLVNNTKAPDRHRNRNRKEMAEYRKKFFLGKLKTKLNYFKCTTAVMFTILERKI